MPYVTFAGQFSTRNEKALIKHSGLITLDFDHVPDIEKLQHQLLRDEYFETELLFTSPNGHGLKWVIAIHLNGTYNHGNWFDAISRYIKESYKIEVDKSGRDVSRACFLTFDPNCFMHPKHGQMNRHWPGEIFTIERKRFNPAQWLEIPKQNHYTTPAPMDKNLTRIQYHVEVILRRIENYQIDLTCNYEDWIRLGFAFADEFGETGRSYFHRVSKFYRTYNSLETDQQYDQCLKSGKSGVTIKTFFAAARDAGINIRV
ncbi:MAG: PriCT-2 domain-containing protein [Bacteroidales bacterium]|nr:PriCT-2 domain-containing protein [Bacteroidales bacterium]